jgi:TonB-dependent SusC/RagA subfamily outer membrane receptor
MKILFSILFLCITTLAVAQNAQKNTKTDNPNINPGTKAVATAPAPPELKPLCFVDGKRVGDADAASVDVNNIASIEILTDSAAVAQYGESARDGVILIHTRNEPFPGKQQQIRSREKEKDSKN